MVGCTSIEIGLRILACLQHEAPCKRQLSMSSSESLGFVDQRVQTLIHCIVVGLVDVTSP